MNRKPWYKIGVPTRTCAKAGPWMLRNSRKQLIPYTISNVGLSSGQRLLGDQRRYLSVIDTAAANGHLAARRDQTRKLATPAASAARLNRMIERSRVR